MNKYATYSYYAEKYGGSLTKNEFNSQIMKACAHVRRITFGRADSNSDLDEVKMAVCAVCDLLCQDDNRRKQYGGRNVASENIDGYSVSYAQEQTQTATESFLLCRRIKITIPTAKRRVCGKFFSIIMTAKKLIR